MHFSHTSQCEEAENITCLVQNYGFGTHRVFWFTIEAPVLARLLSCGPTALTCVFWVNSCSVIVTVSQVVTL